MGEAARDLSFAPVATANPSHLTDAQIAAFNEDGFVRPLDVFTPEEVVRNRDYFDSLLAQSSNDSGAYSINCYQARCEGIWDLCTEPRILDLVEDLIGPNIICWASHFFCKLPNDPKRVPWHQDASYWNLSPARTVTAWLAIDDADEENAAMRFIPGTHRNGHLKFRRATDASAILDIETVDADKLGTPVSNNLRAGQVSLHADMLVHGSEPNDSSRRRCGLTLRYCAPEVGITDDGWARHLEPIVCRGTTAGNAQWQHHERPVGDDVSPENSPHNIGGN